MSREAKTMSSCLMFLILVRVSVPTASSVMTLSSYRNSLPKQTALLSPFLEKTSSIFPKSTTSWVKSLISSVKSLKKMKQTLTFSDTDSQIGFSQVKLRN